MKTIAMMLVGACVVVALNSCGKCPCSSYNKDHLRDVPVSRSASFR